MSEKCPTCHSDDPKVRKHRHNNEGEYAGEECRVQTARTYCRDSFHDTPTPSPTDAGQEPQHPASSAAQSVPTDEVRDALRRIRNRLSRVTRASDFTVSDADAVREAKQADQRALATLEAALSRESAELADALDHITKLEAALSRNTEHDRLMREVVEAARLLVGNVSFVSQSRDQCSGYAGRAYDLNRALDHLTDYEGRSHA